jgi:hypothetical protein
MTRITNKRAPKLRKAPQPPLSYPGATADSDRAKKPSLSEPSATHQEQNPGDRVEGLAEAVCLMVITGVSFDCIFWPEQDGWSGVCRRLMVTVRGCSFEDAQKHMEAALQEHIEGILRKQLARGAPGVS